MTFPDRHLHSVSSWLAAAVALAAIGMAGPMAATATPALAVHVQGTTLVDQSGAPVRLLGVNRSGAEYACIQGWGFFDGPVDASSIAAITSWHVNTVRVPLNEDCWLGINGVSSTYGGARYRAAITSYVSALHSAGLYVILDLHWNAPGTHKADGQQVMADLDHSPGFWRSVANTFKSDPAVVFELYNEPHDISWTCWLKGCTTSDGWQTAGMQRLLNAVRNTGATQPVLAGGLGWAGDDSGWLAHRPKDPANQLAAAWHIYNFGGCLDAACWAAELGQTQTSVPVVTTEFGENDCAAGFVNQWMPWADSRGLSYLGWAWDTSECNSGPALITSYDGTPTAYGAGLKNHLAGLG